ncbi:hypothetical protein AB0J72_55335 [Dactylosporangium sp. NPDC049742]|uniref:hypothetical protein n=1 Tax=Dactylosporangium sp. NPDC049742 TaxID=3154737 RepID=UPI003447981D
MVFRRSSRQDRVRHALAAAVYEGDRRARERVERWWAAGGDDREKVWRGAWFLLSAASFRFGNHERPAQVAPVLEFLLEPDPTSAYRPQVRLTACLPQTAADPPSGVYQGDPYVQSIVEAAVGFPHERLRQRLTDLLADTDQPGLLDALEVAVRPYARPGHRFIGTAPAGRDARQDMWLGEQGALLRIVLANPELPRPPADPGDVDLALLAVLKQRQDLLPAFDQGALAARLVEYAGTDLPEAALDLCRHALRGFTSPKAVAVVCDQAVLGNPEAAAAARDAGYRPAWTSGLLLLTRQFDAYREHDPDGRVLQLACARKAPEIREDTVVGLVLAFLDTDPPEDIAAAVRRSLRDLGAGTGDSLQDLHRLWMRRAILARAVKLEPEAVAAVVDAGYLPEDDEPALLPLLFLTEQFDRYDREDPDGTKLRAALTERRFRYEHEHFRTVAERNGRDDPWPPYEPPPERYRSGVHVTTWPSSMGGGGHSFGGYP